MQIYIQMRMFVTIIYFITQYSKTLLLNTKTILGYQYCVYKNNKQVKHHQFALYKIL